MRRARTINHQRPLTLSRTAKVAVPLKSVLTDMRCVFLWYFVSSLIVTVFVEREEYASEPQRTRVWRPLYVLCRLSTQRCTRPPCLTRIRPHLLYKRSSTRKCFHEEGGGGSEFASHGDVEEPCHGRWLSKRQTENARAGEGAAGWRG
ncbi:hypothetical protein HYPSUDRAFT_543198 [Hypholoma sublateritium FD-334 SS-4]|uniref:Uncharacterized protein n=1 Tax=Hypholoma sublateritium (strain FD-334 SS-4) TaxID=945553 RepID=A0A0D2NAE3_HYPSF|nr:hypothetical protein HYPSUDRAFT_543198 [Hypholoma sublateritium FD-334 SS-4]